jgi:hypothetical protein
VRRKVTSYGAAAASLRRALYACESDQALRDDNLKALSKAAAASGSSEVLIWARAVAGDERWLHWREVLCMAAAGGNQLPTLQWLCTDADAQEQQQVHITAEVAVKAARCADLTMLQWICEQRAVWTRPEVLTVSAAAAAAAAVDKLVWLRAQYA